MSCFQVIAKNLDQAQNWQYQENHASHISGEFPDILYSEGNFQNSRFL